MALNLAALRKKPHTSASALKTFLMCPRLYFFRYVQREPEAFRSSALAYGKAFHVVAQQHLRTSSETAKIPLEQLVESFRVVFAQELSAGSIPVLFDTEEQSTDELVDKASKMLAVFVDQFPLPSHVIGIEVPFELGLRHPITGQIAELPLVGAMDVVAEFSERTRVLELKTAARRFGPESDDSIQPTIYKMAAKQLGYMDAEVEFVVVTKAKTPKLQRLLCERFERDTIELVELALCVERAVGAGVNYRRRDPHNCRSCGYAQRCAP
jgi:CRISPR/Cas system-associated exonuclease Cas4 (RecB family)